ncbi:MAG: hypothetical protein IJ828_00460 [Treponema sp.]|nr:hypothetical protein [Treponema sp.]
MASEILIHTEADLKSKIYTIRGIQVMLDSDLKGIITQLMKNPPRVLN